MSQTRLLVLRYGGLQHLARWYGNLAIEKLYAMYRPDSPQRTDTCASGTGLRIVAR